MNVEVAIWDALGGLPDFDDFERTQTVAVEEAVRFVQAVAESEE